MSSESDAWMEILPVEFVGKFEEVVAKAATDTTSLNTLVKARREDRLIRVKFWDEFEKARAEGRRMELLNIVAGVCRVDYALGRLGESRYWLEWVMVPLIDERLLMREMMEHAMEKIRGILELPEQTPILEKDVDGHDMITGYKLNEKVLSLKLKAIDMIDKRLHGDYAQTSTVKHENAGAKSKAQKSLEDLDKEIALLEAGGMPTALAASETVIPRIVGVRK